MEHNATTQTVVNMALLPNFLLWLGMFGILATLWYFLEYRH